MSQADRRELWTKIHRWCGLTAMAFLAIAAVTGCILCVDRPLDRALNRDLFVRQSDGDGESEAR